MIKLIKNYKMYKKYFEAWSRLKHYIAYRYGIYNTSSNVIGELRNILEYTQSLEYDINEG